MQRSGRAGVRGDTWICWLAPRSPPLAPGPAGTKCEDNFQLSDGACVAGDGGTTCEDVSHCDTQAAFPDCQCEWSGVALLVCHGWRRAAKAGANPAMEREGPGPAPSRPAYFLNPRPNASSSFLPLSTRPHAGTGCESEYYLEEGECKRLDDPSRPGSRDEVRGSQRGMPSAAQHVQPWGWRANEPVCAFPCISAQVSVCKQCANRPAPGSRPPTGRH